MAFNELSIIEHACYIALPKNCFSLDNWTCHMHSSNGRPPLYPERPHFEKRQFQGAVKGGVVVEGQIF